MSSTPPPSARVAPRLSPVLIFLSACSELTMQSGDIGVTPGGMQDIGLAREIIDAGGIPRHEHFTAEGLFSEHDLPLSGETCTAVLCPRAAAAVASPLDGAPDQVRVQLGFGTQWTSETFERLPLNVSVVVDVSGSMADGKLSAVKRAIHRMIEQLGPDDQMGLIAFDEEAWVESNMRMADAEGREHLHDAVDQLIPQGGTNIEAGLIQGYGQVAPDAGLSGVGHRVMLFTDAQPNVGSTGIQSFLGMARYYGASGIGLSVFGVGLDLGSELMTEIAETRGGNAFTLLDEEAIRTVFDEDFDYIVSPIAYDLSVAVQTQEGVQFAEAYGAPLDREQADTCSFGVTSLFLSSRNGGIGATLDLSPDLLQPGATLAEFGLRYETLRGELREEVLSIAWQGGAEIEGLPTLADDLGVYKMSTLIDAFHALQAGADFCDGVLDAATAEARIAEAEHRLQSIADHLADEGLTEEAQLVARLQANLLQGGYGACWAADAYGY